MINFIYPLPFSCDSFDLNVIINSCMVCNVYHSCRTPERVCHEHLTLTSIIIVTLWVRVFRFFPGRNLSERKLRLEKSRRRYDYYGDTKITGCALRPLRPRLVSTGCRYTPPTPHPSPVTSRFGSSPHSPPVTASGQALNKQLI